MNWEQLISNKRLGQEDSHYKRRDDRTEFRRDYDRLIFSAPFRRLQNKTQVFPLPGSIFVHNRLTHSLEVASLGRSLGDDVARQLIAQHPELSGSHLSECGSIVSAACLAHDLGNPPFGHSGEKSIATYFSEGAGRKWQKDLSDAEWDDLTHFDGNANAFRILTHQFKGRRPGGFVMTYSTLASTVKYPFPSSLAGKKQKFGFFQREASTYRKIASDLGIRELSENRWCRYPLVYLVEAADDICYEVMDIEDAHKLGILSTEETKHLLMGFVDSSKHAHMEMVMEQVDDVNEQIAYLRSCAIGVLERECVRVFTENENKILSGEFEGALIKHISAPVQSAYKTCEDISIKKIYKNKNVLDIELSGYKIITQLIDLFVEAVMTPDRAYSRLLLDRVSPQYDVHAPNAYDRLMAVVDYVSGMTDVFALDLYRKINGESIPTI